MLPVPLRMETAAVKHPPSMGRVKGETRYFPTLKGLWIDDPSGRGHNEMVAGLTVNGALGRAGGG
jgi:hypothetical protein